MLKTITFALAAAAAATTAVPATAQESRVVRYDDLNLASQAGVERLERRIDQAARSVCGYGFERTRPGELARSRECFAKARAQAREQMARLDSYQTLGG